MVFALSTVLQQKGTFAVEGGISLRRPRAFLKLLITPVWLAGMGVMVLGWALQAAALDGGEVAIVQTFLTMTLVFVLPLGWWLTDQRVSRREVVAAVLVVLGLVVFSLVGDPAEGRSDAPSWQWLASTAAVAVLSVLILRIWSDRGPAARAAANGAVSGATAALLAVMAKPVLDDLKDGLGALLTDPKTYLVVVLAILGVVFQQVGLGTGFLAPTVASGSVLNPVLSVILGAVVLQETLARPTWRAVVGCAGLALALAAAVVITMSHSGAPPPAAAGTGAEPPTPPPPAPGSPAPT
ncbi:MAG: DMT family transporter [Thermoleophilia bacterium]|nr:DMT family transporter [Thermoleophilia bacterium]